MFSKDEMRRAIEDALKSMEGVALELYRRGREEAREELKTVKRERDEARAEVERLKREVSDARIALKAQEHRDQWLMAQSVGYGFYKRGAEAMREACAKWVNHWVSGHVADKLRDLPIPEDK